MGKSDQASKVTHVGLDCHRRFSTLSGRDAAGRVIVRQKLDHADRAAMGLDLSRFTRGTPVVLEGSFGWGWVCDEITAAGLEPHLASGSKVGGWRKARGIAKNNKLDADLLSEVWEEKQRWWEVWLPPVAVRDQRELLRYRMSLVRIQTGLKNRVHALLHRHGVVGQIERFASKRALARYSCLAPPADDSGEDDGSTPIGRHVGHAGRRTLKWAWIEAAHGAVRHGGRLKAIFDRRTDGGKRDRNRGYIAVAHELCTLGDVLWTREVDYTDNPPPRPGSRPGSAADKTTTTISAPNDQAGRTAGQMIEASSARDRAGEANSRSGTGLPDCTMARGRRKAAARSLCK